MKRIHIVGIVCICMATLIGYYAFDYARQLHSTYLSASLVKAIKVKDVAATVLLLKQGANPRTRFSGEEAHFGLRSYLRALLKSPPKTTPHQTSVLMEAVGTMQPEIVKLLLEAGADLDPRAVQYSANFQSASMLRMFLVVCQGRLQG